MSTVALLLERLRTSGTFVALRGPYRLEAASGRPGAICFTLQEIGEQGAQITLGEGFSLHGRLIFEQHTLPEHEIERIILRILSPEPALA